MEIRCYHPSDLESILRLFQDTILSINARDYPSEQLQAWAASARDQENWAARLEENLTLVVEADEEVIAFGELTEAGAIHTLYVHKHHQRKGIARALLGELERWALCWEMSHLCTEASLTARAFFASQGYQLLDQQEKPLNGEVLTNFRMEKELY